MFSILFMPQCVKTAHIHSHAHTTNVINSMIAIIMCHMEGQVHYLRPVDLCQGQDGHTNYTIVMQHYNMQHGG